MLIGELVPEALRFLRNNPACDARRAFDHVIVDEYQDLNRAEQDLIQLLSANGSIAIVGDVDQSIYRFRHANPEGIRAYNVCYPETHDEVLNECRRCPTAVVTIASDLIANNYPAADSAPRLRPLPGNPPGQVHVVQWANLQEEATDLADYIETLVAANVDPGQILVLTPRRLLGYAIRDRVRERAIAVHSFYHEEALEEPHAQRAYTLLSLLVDEEDLVALRWWLGEGSPSQRSGAYAHLKAHCERAGISPKIALDACVAGALNLPNLHQLVAKYRELLEILNGLRPLGLAELVDSLMPAGNDECTVVRETALAGLEESETPGDLLDSVKASVTQPLVPERADYVRVMSLHKSKGLTSRVVIVSGCTHGLIPFVDDTERGAEAAATLEEQRRLFYVAITRCTEILVLSSAARMDRAFAWSIGARVARGGGAIANTIASQFIDELGPGAPVAKRGPAWARGGYRE